MRLAPTTRPTIYNWTITDDRLLAEQEQPEHHHRRRISICCLQVGHLAAAVRAVPGPDATATCAQVGTYITNIIKIKAANASGAATNATLKDQMLATALGGNKIGAPAPIGSVAIDLTKICKNIAICSVYENVSSAFGGATSLTVSQMLDYAASQSNAGGRAWYGQVKATQELAKDAFDAINNQVAFAP